ncbi:hypothetical protein PR048_001415 [Dryococelus australis]|uniref:Uncharacterized protein n=1 Tax=Dryococelus australis TaxID=614101 RepID=A0ABQ9IHA3_9NEOP|nr:hypothetical protein PR048_001415 [Dryococelus australis]
MRYKETERYFVEFAKEVINSLEELDAWLLTNPLEEIFAHGNCADDAVDRRPPKSRGNLLYAEFCFLLWSGVECLTRSGADVGESRVERTTSSVRFASFPDFIEAINKSSAKFVEEFQNVAATRAFRQNDNLGRAALISSTVLAPQHAAATACEVSVIFERPVPAGRFGRRPWLRSPHCSTAGVATARLLSATPVSRGSIATTGQHSIQARFACVSVPRNCNRQRRAKFALFLKGRLYSKLLGPIKYENTLSRQQPMAIDKLLLDAYGIEVYLTELLKAMLKIYLQAMHVAYSSALCRINTGKGLVSLPMRRVRLLASHQCEPGSLPGPGRSQISACGNRARTMPLVGGVLSGISRFPLPFRSGAAPYSPHFTRLALNLARDFPPIKDGLEQNSCGAKVWPHTPRRPPAASPPQINCRLKSRLRAGASANEVRGEGGKFTPGQINRSTGKRRKQFPRQRLVDKYVGKREIPEKTRRPAAASGTIPTCEKPGSDSAGNRTQFGWVAGELSNHLSPRPLHRGFQVVGVPALTRDRHATAPSFSDGVNKQFGTPSPPPPTPFFSITQQRTRPPDTLRYLPRRQSLVPSPGSHCVSAFPANNTDCSVLIGRSRTIFTEVVFQIARNAHSHALALGNDDKIDFKHVYTEVTFAIGSELIMHALGNSQPIADLQGNKKRIPHYQDCDNTLVAANKRTSEARLYKRLLSIAYRTRYTRVTVCSIHSPPSVIARAGFNARLSTCITHTCEPISIPGGVTPGFSHMGIVPDDAIGRRDFSGISRFPPPCHSGAASSLPRFTLIATASQLLQKFFLSKLASERAPIADLQRNKKRIPYSCWRSVLSVTSRTTLFPLPRNKFILARADSAHPTSGGTSGGLLRFSLAGSIPAPGRNIIIIIVVVVVAVICRPLSHATSSRRRIPDAAGSEGRHTRPPSPSSAYRARTFLIVGETGDPRENPPTSGIVRHDSHMRRLGIDPAGNLTRLELGGGISATKLKKECLVRWQEPINKQFWLEYLKYCEVLAAAKRIRKFTSL